MKGLRLLFFLWIVEIFMNFQCSAQVLSGWVSTAGAGNNDKGLSVVPTPSGFIYAMGTYLDTVTFELGNGNSLLNGNPNFNNTFIQKRTNDGVLNWVVGFGGLGESGVTGKKLAITPNGNCILLAHFFGAIDADPGLDTFILNAMNSKRNYCLIELNENGEFVWARNCVQVGEYDDVKNIAIDNYGDIYLSGIFHDSVDFDPGVSSHFVTSNGNSDIFIQKLQPNGDFIWVETFGSSGSEDISSLCLTPFNKLVIAGRFYETIDFDPGLGVEELSAPISTYASFLLQLSTDAEFNWVSFTQSSQEIVSDQSGNIFALGIFQGTIDFDLGLGISQLTSAGLTDAFIIRYSHEGEYLWAKRFGGPNYDFPSGIFATNSGELFCCGSFAGTSDFDPNNGIYELSSSDGFDDVFILKLSNEGDFIWAEKTGGSGNNYERCWDICVNEENDIFFTGQFRDSGIFDPNSIGNQYLSMGYEDMFLAKWLDSPSSISNIKPEIYFHVFPNPTDKFLNIQSAVSLNHSSFYIYDTSGLLVMSNIINDEQWYVDVSCLNPGMYVFKMCANGKYLSKTFVVN